MFRVLLVVGVFGLAAPAAAQPAPAAVPLQVRSGVDRTALWVGDRVTYWVDLVCAPNVDILLDDVSKEKLRLTGLELVSSDATAKTDETGRTVQHLRYVLTTYRVDGPSLGVEALTVRYYARRPGQRLQDTAPAGEVLIPGAVIAFRSTLPETQGTFAIRDARSAEARPWLFAHTQQLGVAALVLLLAPAALVVGGAIRRRAQARGAKRSRRYAKLDHRARIERLKSLDVATEEERRRAYDEIATAVREHVASHAHVPATAMTAAEVGDALSRAGGRLPSESITALIAACDAARYGPPDAVPAPDACRDALTTAEQLLAGR
jgi:hypothetical protein